MRPVGGPSTARVKPMTQTSRLSHRPPVSYIWTKVMTDERTNFRRNSRSNAAYLWVRARCNEKQPEGINDDQITQKGKLIHHRKQAYTSSVPKKLWFQYLCSCKHCQLGLTCGGWWREALKLDESCTPPGHKFAWLNQFLRLEHCWHMEEISQRKQIMCLWARSVGTDRQLLSKPR